MKKNTTTATASRLHAVERSTALSKLAARTSPLFTKWWLWLALLFIMSVVGSVLIVGMSVANAFKKIPLIGSQPTVASVTTLHIQRSGSYDEAQFTILNASNTQYFSDDPIHQGQSTVRLTMQVANPTPHALGIVYYDVVRLLLPKGGSFTPTNVQLSATLNPGKTVTGWIDFSLPYKSVALNAFVLQLGNASLNETLIKIPFIGSYNATQYTPRSFPQNTDITYNYYGQTLTYRLLNVQTRYAYNGMQCKAGQQYYVLNFRVNNAQNKDVSPGYGFDYVRLVLPSNERAPVDNSLPYTFKAGTSGVSGYVVFLAPSNMKDFTIGFLSQNGTGELDTVVHL